MKRIALLMALILVALLLTGCGDDTAQNGGSSANAVPMVLNQAEYIMYQNVFYSNFGEQIDGKQVEKRGVFGCIQDAFSESVRYFVWGYLDNTKCCDWQWEFVPKNTKNLPPVGSVIVVKGTFCSNPDALDNYWIDNATVETESTYSGVSAELNMLTLSDTLERVQVLNILYVPEAFEGKSVIAYGRIAQVNTLQDPYYDGSWQIEFSTSDKTPSTGTEVILKGKVEGGILANCSLAINE